MKKYKTVLILVLIITIIPVALNFSNLFGNDSNTSNKPQTNSPSLPNTDNSGSTSSKDFSNLTYTALGDSITYAWSGYGYSTSYVNVVGEKLNLKSTQNLGKGSATLTSKSSASNSICNQLKNIDTNSDIISVMGGINDIYLHCPLGTIDDTYTDTYYGALNYICSYFSANFSESYIFFMTILPAVDYYDENQKNNDGHSICDYNNAIYEVCNKYGYDVFDTYNAFGNFKSSNYITDGCHPSKDIMENRLPTKIVGFLKANYQ